MSRGSAKIIAKAVKSEGKCREARASLTAAELPRPRVRAKGL